MDMNLNKENINYVKMIYSASFTHEETMELIVPDAQPDILEILDTDAVVLLRSKEADTGRVVISGVINATVLYAPEDSGNIKKLELSMPFSASADGGEISATNRVIAAVSLASVDSRTINPRKILVRADVMIAVNCYEDSQLSVVNAAGGEDDIPVETLSKSCVLSPVTDVAEKTFIITDECMLPGSKPPLGEILKTSVHLASDEAKCVGSKLIFKGVVTVDMLYRSARGEELANAQFSTVFSQIMELETPGEDNIFDLQLVPTGVYCNPIQQAASDDSGISLEVHAVAQCAVSAKREIQYICDAYSSKYEISAREETLEIKGTESCFTQTEMLRETANVTGEIKKIISTSVFTGMASFTVLDGELEMKAGVSVNIVYLAENDAVRCCTQRFNVSSKMEAEDRCSYSVKAAAGKDVYVAIVADGFDIRIPVDFRVEKFAVQKLDMIAGITYEKDAVIDLSNKPSVIVHRVTSGETLWAVAKRYYSTPESICASNNIESEENFAEGSIILIPKIR